MREVRLAILIYVVFVLFGLLFALFFALLTGGKGHPVQGAKTTQVIQPAGQT